MNLLKNTAAYSVSDGCSDALTSIQMPITTILKTENQLTKKKNILKKLIIKVYHKTTAYLDIA
jgi:hypothetical protein